MGQIAIGTSLNKLLTVLGNIVGAHEWNPSYGFGPTEDFNASNDVTFPAIWVEPITNKNFNSIQGVRAQQIGINLYAMDRINKGDNNFQEVMSDMKYLLDTIVAYIADSQYCIDNFISLDKQDGELTPVMRTTDENCNGYRLKLLIRVADLYTECNSPFNAIPVICPVTYVLPNYVDCFYVQ